MADTKITQIYVLLHPTTREIRYVGRTTQTLKARLKGHIAGAVSGQSDTHRDRWIISLLNSNLRPAIEKIDQAGDDWDAVERRWIAHYRAAGARLTNHADGGGGIPGVKMPVEFGEKVRKRQIESWSDPDTRAKWTAGLIEAWASPEARGRQSSRAKVAMNSPEVKARLTASLLVAWSTPERKEICTTRNKKTWENADEQRAAHREMALAQIAAGSRNLENTPEKNAAFGEASKIRWDTPGYKDAHKTKVVAAWTPEMRAAAAERTRARNYANAAKRKAVNEPPSPGVIADIQHTAGASSG